MFTRRRQGISSSQFNRSNLDNDDYDDYGEDNDVHVYVTINFYLASRFWLKHLNFSFRWRFFRYCRNFRGSAFSRPWVFLSKDFSDHHSLSFSILHLLKASLKTTNIKHGIGITIVCVYYCRMFDYFLRGMFLSVIFHIFGTTKNQILFSLNASVYM